LTGRGGACKNPHTMNQFKERKFSIGWIAGGLFLLLVSGGASEGALFLDVGEDDVPAEFGFGWDRFERNNERSFAWVRHHMEADVWIDYDSAAAAKFEILAAAYYQPRRRQSLGLYVNDRFVAEWEFQHGEEWLFETFNCVIPPGVLKSGRNRITLRMGYTGWRGYAVAVDWMKIEPGPTVSESR